MNSLLLFLLLGASVTLAELPFDHPALDGFLNEEGEELFGAELADEENDPDEDQPNRPTPPGFVRMCRKKLTACLKGKDACKKLACHAKFHRCIKSHRPSPRPSVSARRRARVRYCARNVRGCFCLSRNSCIKKLICLGRLRYCLRRRRPRPTPSKRPS